MNVCEALVEKYLRRVERDLRCVAIDQESRLLVDTPYLFSDGDVVQVVVEYLPEGLVRIGDEGTVLARLELAGVELGKASKATKEARSILRSYRVDLVGDELRVENESADTADMFLRLVGAMRAIDGLSALRADPAPTRFERRVLSFLHSQFQGVGERPERMGKSGSRYRLTASVPRADHEVLVQSASGGQPQTVRRAVEHAFRVFADINGQLPKDQKLVILSADTWPDEDLRLLGGVAYVGGWAEQENILGFLKGEKIPEEPFLVPWQTSIES
jgi:hypothetical protein